MESLREALRRFIDVVPHAGIFEDTGSPWHHKMLENTDQITLAHISLSKMAMKIHSDTS